MPRYTYHCEKCEEYFEASHGMSDRPTLECDCGETLVKSPSVPLSLKVKKIDAKTGDVVKSSIEEFKKDLKKQRTDASKKEV